MNFLSIVTKKAARVATGVAFAAGLSAASFTAAYAQDVTLRGASMFDDNHAFTKTMRKFAELVGENYDGDVEFDLRLNGELGVEKDYVNFLQQGVAIDYTIMAPSNMAKFAPAIPLMDMPFLFRDLNHWDKVLSSDAFGPLEAELEKNADIKIIGYTGGGVRNLVSSKPIANMDDLAGHKMRVMGAPIQAQTFSALTAAPSAIAYNEVYNAIQSGVIAGFENEAASIQNLKFYEVAPHVTLTKHTITVRPIVMSGKTFRKLPEDLQAAVLKAGKEAGAYGRELESREDGLKLQEMIDAGQVQVQEFEGREKLLEMVIPVQDAYAAEIEATDLLANVRGM
jgi:tripartite ATP-independent transporter DctP family solute receptor